MRKSLTAILFTSTIAVVCMFGTARADSPAVPPPSVSVEPDAPIVSRRFLVQYQMFIYPAYRSWLAASNGEIDSIIAFTRFLAELPLTPYERFCYTQCYLMHYRS